MSTLLPNISKSKIVIIGDVMLDAYMVGDVSRISPEAPVPVVLVKQKTSTLGGAGNVALNLARLGANAHLIGVRGADVSGRVMSELLQGNGIMDCMVTDDSHPTTTKTRIMGQRQQLIRFDEEKHWEYHDQLKDYLLDMIEKTIKGASCVILSDYFKGVLTGDVAGHTIGICKARKIPIFVDPKRKEWERYRGATCVTPNIPEIEEISGMTIGRNEHKLVEQSRKLRKQYSFEWLLATRGPDGMCLIGPDEEPFFIKSVAQEVYDVSGAGDTVVATLAAAVSCSISFQKAAEISNIAAGIVVGKLGSQPIDIKELEAAWRSKESGISHVHRVKISSLDSSLLRVQAWKAMNEKIVMTHGCFDLLHPGHIHHLNNAKNLGDRLIVGVYSDEFVRKLKGKNRPVLNQDDRAHMLSEFQCVDLVVLLDEHHPNSMIKLLCPDFFVKGADPELDILVEDEYLTSNNCKVETLVCSNVYSSRNMIDKILNK